MVLFHTTGDYTGFKRSPSAPPTTTPERHPGKVREQIRDCRGLLRVPHSAGQGAAAGAMPADGSSVGVTRHWGESQLLLGCSDSQARDSRAQCRGTKVVERAGSS